MTKLWDNDYSHLDQKTDFPRVHNGRSLQAKIKGRWVTVYNFMIYDYTCHDRRHLDLSDWPEYAEVCAEFPQATKFRIDWTKSVLPWYSMR